ncbi:hypothetical protein NUW54_g8025 [Trametes sanguinea]|uniref:Uncharacterized protein n=1 Tax=Trametes sanguinea TaxID=158606 RepID=A0ACC1PH86_9APHY|nr:hypothetical protein NUW54_g8025 [Trametes sanguinea]
MHPQLCQEHHPRSSQFALHSNQVRAPLPSGVQYALQVSPLRSSMFIATVQCSEGYLRSSPTYAATWSGGTLERTTGLLSGKVPRWLYRGLRTRLPHNHTIVNIGSDRADTRSLLEPVACSPGAHSPPSRAPSVRSIGGEPRHRRTSATLVCSDSDSARWQIFVPRADRQLYRPLAKRRTRNNAAAAVPPAPAATLGYPSTSSGVDPTPFRSCAAFSQRARSNAPVPG